LHARCFSRSRLAVLRICLAGAASHLGIRLFSRSTKMLSWLNTTLAAADVLPHTVPIHGRRPYRVPYDWATVGFGISLWRQWWRGDRCRQMDTNRPLTTASCSIYSVPHRRTLTSASSTPTTRAPCPVTRSLETPDRRDRQIHCPKARRVEDMRMHAAWLQSRLALARR
jgi:hypothetical protein